MILFKHYDPEKEIEDVWYESSSVLYSHFDEKAGDLYVVFAQGPQYVYHNVNVADDYTLFKYGGLENSQGRALNKYIKPKYECERIEDADLGKLMELRRRLEDAEADEKVRRQTVFISGHRDITEEEFRKIYVPAIEYSFWEFPRPHFIMGDYQGVDKMAQDYLMDEKILGPDQITVYHMLDKPRNANSRITSFKGGFTSDEERDAAMTRDSVKDIAFVRDHLKMSGTAMNILRRRSYQNAEKNVADIQNTMIDNPLGPGNVPSDISVDNIADMLTLDD